jgi:hypothetical protein
MPTPRLPELLVLAAALGAVLAGCATGGSAEVPAGVRLEGAWKLDHDASDDPQKVIDHLREAAAKYASRMASRSALPPPSGGGMGRRGPPGQVRTQEQDEDMSGVQRFSAAEILAHSPAMNALTSFINRGDYLTVREGPEHFLLDYGSTSRSFTPGVHSVVGADTGVADQVSGWKGKEYVINVTPQIGPSITEEYGLSDDQKHLIAKLHVGGSELPSVDLKRVYNRTDEVAPRAAPTND